MSQGSVSGQLSLYDLTILAARAEEEIPETAALAIPAATGTAAAKHPNVIASASRHDTSIALAACKKPRTFNALDRRHNSSDIAWPLLMSRSTLSNLTSGCKKCCSAFNLMIAAAFSGAGRRSACHALRERARFSRSAIEMPAVNASKVEACSRDPRETPESRAASPKR